MLAAPLGVIRDTHRVHSPARGGGWVAEGGGREWVGGQRRVRRFAAVCYHVTDKTDSGSRSSRKQTPRCVAAGLRFRVRGWGWGWGRRSPVDTEVSESPVIWDLGEDHVTAGFSAHHFVHRNFAHHSNSWADLKEVVGFADSGSNKSPTGSNGVSRYRGSKWFPLCSSPRTS